MGLRVGDRREEKRQRDGDRGAEGERQREGEGERFILTTMLNRKLSLLLSYT